MDPRNISSSCAANDSGVEENCKGHYTAKIRRAKKENSEQEKSVSFLWQSLKQTKRMLLYQFYMIEPIRPLGRPVLKRSLAFDC